MRTLGRATAVHHEPIWRLGGLSPWQLLCNVRDEMIANNLVVRAAELAFYFLFALFPLILVMMTLFGLFTTQRIELQNHLLSYFADFLPPTAFHLLQTVASDVSTNASGGKLTLGIVFALWSVSTGICSTISALNSVNHVRESRSWLKVRAIALALTLLITALLLSALFLALVSNDFVGWFGTRLGLQPIVVLVWRAIQWPASIFFVSISCLLIDRFGPDLKGRHWHWMTPGTALGLLAWIVASRGFCVYLHFSNHYGATYGSLGAVMILLLWLYISGLAYLLGGTINAEIQRAATRGP